MLKVHVIFDDVDSFISVDLRDLYVISVGCVSSHGAIVWNTVSGTASST